MRGGTGQLLVVAGVAGLGYGFWQVSHGVILGSAAVVLLGLAWTAIERSAPL